MQVQFRRPGGVYELRQSVKRGEIRTIRVGEILTCEDIVVPLIAIGQGLVYLLCTFPAVRR